MEDDLNFLERGRQSKFFGKWKITPKVWKTEDDLNCLENGRRPQFIENGRQLNFL